MNIQEIIDHYLFVGYSMDIISLAIEDSKTKTYEDVGRLLSWNHQEYEEAIANSALNKAKGKDYKQSKNTKKNAKTIRKPEDSQELWELIKIQGSKTHKEKKNKGKRKGKVLGEDDLEINKVLQAMINDLKKVGLGITNRNIIKVTGYLEDIRRDTSLKMIFADKGSDLVKEFGDQIFIIIEKSVKLKMDPAVKIDKTVLEILLDRAFEVRIITENQMSSLLNSYQALCEKPENVAEANIISKLMDYYTRKNIEVPSLNVPKKQEKLKGNKKEKGEENKQEVGQVKEKDLVQEEEILGVAEECLICMRNTREIVFLPCSHFLTCSLCSVKINKCPLCTKAIEQSLKIYWA